MTENAALVSGELETKIARLEFVNDALMRFHFHDKSPAYILACLREMREDIEPQIESFGRRLGEQGERIDALCQSLRELAEALRMVSLSPRSPPSPPSAPRPSPKLRLVAKPKRKLR